MVGVRKDTLSTMTQFITMSVATTMTKIRYLRYPGGMMSQHPTKQERLLAVFLLHKQLHASGGVTSPCYPSTTPVLSPPFCTYHLLQP